LAEGLLEAVGAPVECGAIPTLPPMIANGIGHGFAVEMSIQ
jgi:hypothetical protein